jgi:hypothetical protein
MPSVLSQAAGDVEVGDNTRPRALSAAVTERTASVNGRQIEKGDHAVI